MKKAQQSSLHVSTGVLALFMLLILSLGMPQASADEPFHALITKDTEPDGKHLHAGRTGEFRTSFTERSPLSSIQVFARRFGWTLGQIRERDPKAGQYDLAEETFEVYVPSDYRGDEPLGLFVWLSPSDSGSIPPGIRPVLKQILDWHRLIWVGANNAGNDRKVWYRENLALDAVHNMKQLYAIDEERVYASGLSGGGRCSSGVAVAYPEAFHGGFYMMGCNYYRRLMVPDKSRRYYAHFHPPSRETLKLIKKRNRYVLLTGEHDGNRQETKTIYEAYKADGFEHVTYIEIPELGHTLPGPEWFDKGILLLDTFP